MEISNTADWKLTSSTRRIERGDRNTRVDCCIVGRVRVRASAGARGVLGRPCRGGSPVAAARTGLAIAIEVGITLACAVRS
eukprot:3454095-Rhodomonas_salina.1